MLQYVNCFSCISNKKNDSIVIRFNQNEPVAAPNGTGGDVPECMHDIASLIMDSECAEALVDALKQILADSQASSDKE